MRVSLLYREKGACERWTAEERLIYHLSLDRAFAHVCADVKKRDIFFSVLRELSTGREEIAERQEILRDFVSQAGLLGELMSLCERFEKLREDWRTAGRDDVTLSANRTASAEASRNLLQAQALCAKRALLFVKGFGDLLASRELRSRGLRELLSACREMTEQEDFARMLAFCARYESFSSSGCLDFAMEIDDGGRVAEWALIDHRHIRITDPEVRRRGFALFRRAEEAPAPCERVFRGNTDFYEKLTVAALADLSRLFSSVAEQIFARFGALSRELDFYFVALRYTEVLAERGITPCYPVLSERGTRVRGLYDLCLLLSAVDARAVVPNDVILPREGMGLLVFGGNGSGKTVYLRAVGAMQLLAQAGLPIPAAEAEVTPCTQLATQFSEAEKDFCAGNDAGRFEQEVRELAAMVDGLRAGALVLLNETFQSTAYAEGAEGLCHLLRHFSACGIRWVLVTHLHALEDAFSPTEAAVMHTAEGFRVVAGVGDG